jgi:selenide,water dikinase
LGPCDLAQVLEGLKPIVDPRLLVGPETMDDAAVVMVSDELAVCLTADFITPLVDDPRDWGWIAAANSLSDVYAMGGKPLAALNLVCWPGSLPGQMLAEVLSGGADAAAAAGCMIVGGHTVQDAQPKYGLAVLGTVPPDSVLRNRGALPGDLLYLTKPLGTGIVATAIKADFASPAEIAAAVASMKTLNRAASEAALAAGARALTDVTGFGLAGHLSEMLGPDAALGAILFASRLPVLPGAMRLIAQGMVPGGTHRNRDAYGQRLHLAGGTPDGLDLLLLDPQTSGGLLAAIPANAADRFEAEAARRDAAVWCIGQFSDTGRIDVCPGSSP